MANLKVSELPDLGAQAAGDRVVGNRSGSTGRITLQAVNVPLWSSSPDWPAGSLARLASGDVYVATQNIDAGTTAGPDGGAGWSKVDGFRGPWTSGEYLRKGEIVEHSSAFFLVIADIGPSNTAPASDATHFLRLGEPADGPSIPGWAIGGNYSAHRLVRDGSRIYIVLQDIANSQNHPSADVLHFEALDGFEGGYLEGKAYPAGSAVTHGGHLYYVIRPVPASNSQAPAANSAFIRIDVQITHLPPAWDAETNRSAGDQVAYSEKIYLALGAIAGDSSNQNPLADTANWAPVGRALTTAEEGVLSDSPLAWNRTTTYAQNDQVSRSRKIYVSQTDSNVGNDPATDTTNWAVVGPGTGTGSSTTNLGVGSRDADSLNITSSTGTDATIPSANLTEAGLESAADKTLLEGMAADILVFWSPTAQHTVADGVGYGDGVTLAYGTSSTTLTVRAARRDDHTVTLVVASGTDWAAVQSEAAATLTTLGGDRFGAFTIASLQTTQAAVDASGEWFLGDNIPAAGVEAWREMARIDELDNTHLGVGTRTATTMQITSSTGDNISVPSANATQAGLESAADKAVVDAMPPVWTAAVYTVGAQRSWAGVIYECRSPRQITDTDNPAADAAWVPLTALGATDLSLGTRTGTALDIASSSGNDVTLPAATPSAAGLESAADKSKLDAQVPEWTDTTYSAAGIQRVHGGILYETTQAIAAATGDAPPDDTTNWRRITVPDVPSLANYRTATQITTEIDAAVADAVVDRGDWSASDAYVENDQVHNDGATYIATADVAANTAAATEPGTGSAWEDSWTRVGFEDGPPNAFVDASRAGESLTLTRESGTNPLTVDLGTGELVFNQVGSSNYSIGSGERQTWRGVAGGQDDIDISDVSNDDLIAVSIHAGGWPRQIFMLEGSAIVAGVTAAGSVGTARRAIEIHNYSRNATDWIWLGRDANDHLLIGVSHDEIDPAPLTLWKLGGEQERNRTRAERVTFQAIAQTNALRWATPITTDPVSVVAGTGDPQIVTAISGNPAIDLTVAAGVYLIDIVGNMDGAGANNDCVFWLTDTSENVLDASTPVALDSSSRIMGAKLALVLEDDTDVRIRLRPLSGQTAIAVNWTATFIRWGGGETRTVTQQFTPTELGTTTFAGTGAALDQALTDGDGNALVVPENGWIIAVSTIAPINLEGATSWHLAEDLRDTARDTSLTLGLYTNDDNELLAYVDDESGVASTSNEIIIFHVGTTDADSSGAAVTPRPSILRFDVTGERSPAAGSIADAAYDYVVEISQSAHVGSARIIGFVGTEANPSNFSTLATFNSGNYHHAEGTIRIPAGTSLSANQTYTLRLEVYPDGTPDTGAPTIYHDYRITAHAIAASVHFGLAPFTDGQTIQQVIAGIVFGTHDISTAAQAAGDYDFGNIPDDGNEYVPYWAVPDALTQPTSFQQSNQPVAAIVVGNALAYSTGGVDYTVYHYELDDRIDTNASGVVTTVS